jgi:PDZ domain-containing protein
MKAYKRRVIVCSLFLIDMTINNYIEKRKKGEFYMRKITIGVIFGLLLVIVAGISLLNMPSKGTEQLKEGSILGVNQFISSESLGGKEKSESNFYLTYVHTRSTSNRLSELLGNMSGYEKSVAPLKACSDFNYNDENEYAHRILPYMSLNAISSALHAANIEPMGVLLDPVVLSTSYKSETGKLFEPGDKLITMNGEDIEIGNLFNFMLNEHKEGDRITIVIERDGKRKDISFIAKERDCNNQLTAGIYAETTIDITNVDEAKIIDTSKMQFAGNSAGLMLSLGLVQQLRPELDLTKGKKIAGTGAINVIGVVGAIGALDVKIRTAIKEGVDVFLYPKAQSDEIKNNYEDKILLIPVESLDQAINELQKIS